MRKPILLLLAAGLVLASCSAPSATETATVEQPTSNPAVTATPIQTPSSTPTPAPTPFPMQDGAFTGAPRDFVIFADEFGGQFVTADAGTEALNASILEARGDGQAYLDATGRLDGWRIQFDRQGEGGGPLYVVNVVNTYDSAEGAALSLSQEWHSDVWMLINSGVLVRLPDIPNLDAEQLVWQNSSGTIGVELVYRNLYILFTGPTEGSDQYQFFADLAKAHLDWIKAGEP